VPVPPPAVKDAGELLMETWHLVSVGLVGDVSDVSEDVHAAAMHARRIAPAVLTEPRFDIGLQPRRPDARVSPIRAAQKPQR